MGSEAANMHERQGPHRHGSLTQVFGNLKPHMGNNWGLRSPFGSNPVVRVVCPQTPANHLRHERSRIVGGNVTQQQRTHIWFQLFS